MNISAVQPIFRPEALEYKLSIQKLGQDHLRPLDDVWETITVTDIGNRQNPQICLAAPIFGINEAEEVLNNGVNWTTIWKQVKETFVCFYTKKQTSCQTSTEIANCIFQELPNVRGVAIKMPPINTTPWIWRVGIEATRAHEQYFHHRLTREELTVLVTPYNRKVGLRSGLIKEQRSKRHPMTVQFRLIFKPQTSSTKKYEIGESIIQLAQDETFPSIEAFMNRGLQMVLEEDFVEQAGLVLIRNPMAFDREDRRTHACAVTFNIPLIGLTELNEREKQMKQLMYPSKNT